MGHSGHWFMLSVIRSKQNKYLLKQDLCLCGHCGTKPNTRWLAPLPVTNATEHKILDSAVWGMDKLLRGTIGSYALGVMGEEQHFGIGLTFTFFQLFCVF